MHQQFLLVVPDGWTDIGDINVILQHTSIDNIQSSINEQTWWAIDQVLEAAGLLPLNQNVSEANLFNDGTQYKLWVRYTT